MNNEDKKLFLLKIMSGSVLAGATVLGFLHAMDIEKFMAVRFTTDNACTKANEIFERILREQRQMRGEGA